MYDVMIIGAGVTGSAIARELMRKKRNIAVLERCSDICEGTSKANSGIVHAGFDATPGTLKAKMNVQGSRMMEALSKELDFSYKRNGSLVLCFNEADRSKAGAASGKGREKWCRRMRDYFRATKCGRWNRRCRIRSWLRCMRRQAALYVLLD